MIGLESYPCLYKTKGDEMKQWKKVWSIMAMCGVAAGMANAQTQTSWTPSVQPPEVAYWDEPNWSAGVPVAGLKATFSASALTECIVRTEAYSGNLVLGDNGTGKTSFRIVAGGNLTCGAVGSWVGVGYNREAQCVIEAGGVMNSIDRLGVGLVPGGVGLLEVYGTLVIAKNLQVGMGNDAGNKVQIYEGGTITANGLEMGATSPEIDIWETGTLTFDVDYTNVLGFIASGNILGNRLTNNLNVVTTEVSPGVTNTVVSAKPSIPNLAGLMPAEAEAMLTVFGYTLGPITTNFMDGALTGSVIATVPAAGTAPLAPGSAIGIVVQAAGSVPNVVGKLYSAATNTLVQAGYVVGTETINYVYGATPSLVTNQNPVGGAGATPGSAVDIWYNEPMAVRSTISANQIGDYDWMNEAAWNPSIVPWKEVQNYDVRVNGDASLTLANFVAMPKFSLGMDGTIATATLNVLSGGSLIGGWAPDFVALGWNRDCVVNIYSNALIESRDALRIGWNGSSANVTIDGGTLKSKIWMSLGISTKTNPATMLPYESTITIKNGGDLSIGYFRGAGSGITYFFGKITMERGTISISGTDTNKLQSMITSNMIVFAEGYTNSLSVVGGRATLSSFIPQAVPNIVNSTEAAARTSITNAGLVVGTVTSNYSASVAAGLVISQNPAASAPVAPGSAVGFVVSLGVENIIDQWLVSYGLTAGSSTNDPDGDGFSNLYEYSFDGNPTNDTIVGTSQVISNAAGVLTYTFRVRNNDPKLTYSVETTDNLVTGPWANVGYTTQTGSVADGNFNIVTHTIPVSDLKKFVRVKVTQAP
jgi:beta-lactam-binding protein with PASTA domain